MSSRPSCPFCLAALLRFWRPAKVFRFEAEAGSRLDRSSALRTCRSAGVNKVGAEGDIFWRTIGYSLLLPSCIGLVAMIQAYVIPGIVPAP